MLIIIEPFDVIYSNRLGYKQVLKLNNFNYFFISWVIFNITNGLFLFVETGFLYLPEFEMMNKIGTYLIFLGVILFSFLGGILSDRLGRKQPLIIGFIILGISYTIVGITNSPQSWMLRNLILGISWGFIIVSYQWAILSDLSSTYSKETFFALGIGSASLIEAIFQLLFSQISFTINANIITTVLSILLFVAVFPLMKASETLPEKYIQENKLKKYLDAVFSLLEESKIV